ncbi:hypothetical protein BH24PSE2_BH24PSE2_18320 [soil metagenome]
MAYPDLIEQLATPGRSGGEINKLLIQMQE